jgi:hypothetical protein
MTQPWLTVCQGQAPNENAGGVPEGSRGLRSAATIPPGSRSRNPCTLEGCQNDLVRAFLAPLRGADVFASVVRGYRSRLRFAAARQVAQPPATFLHPSGMPDFGGAQ